MRRRVGAGAPVLTDRPEVLLVRRGDNGLWDLPGGAVDVGEEVEAAARREVLEETGLSPGPLTLLGVFSGERHRHTYPGSNVVAWVTVLSTAPHTGGTPRAGDDAALPTEVGGATRAYFGALRAHVGETA